MYVRCTGYKELNTATKRRAVSMQEALQETVVLEVNIGN
jgi:hypothetical protein